MLSDYWKIFLQYFIPKHLLTNFAGLMANIRIPSIKNYLIQDFIAKYGVNMSEALEENPLNYTCFNDFFIRHLKPEKRPLSCADIISPVDGSISEIGRIEQGQLLQAKGRYYTVKDLLACEEKLSQLFNSGCFATFYLSPKDYHRIHMPIYATLRNMIYIPGKLFSVQPATTRVIPQLFTGNERVVIFFDTIVGLMALVLVGATIVGSIGTSWHGDMKRSKVIRYFNYQNDNNTSISLSQGAEVGYFKLGSTVVLLFANGQQITWQLTAGNLIQYGQALGTISSG